MNPNHAACFNELRELCGRYGLVITSDDERVILTFENSNSAMYYAVLFSSESQAVYGRQMFLDTPPPETKGDKNDT